MTLALFIPGLLSDARVWRDVASRVPCEVAFADVTRDDTITGMARRLLDEHQGELIVIGHSMGARVAIELAHLAPDRVSHLVVANTGHDGLKDGELALREAKIELGYKDMSVLANEWLPPMIGPEKRQDEKFVENLQDMVLGFSPHIHEAQIRALIARPVATETLPNLACPILVLAADQDEWCSVEQHKVIADLAQNSEFRLVENTGHFLPIERSEEMAEIVLDWLCRKCAF